jgi:hypothetical protein
MNRFIVVHAELDFHGAVMMLSSAAAGRRAATDGEFRRRWGDPLLNDGAPARARLSTRESLRPTLGRADVLVQELDLEALLLRLGLDDVPDRDDAHHPTPVVDDW